MEAFFYRRGNCMFLFVVLLVCIMSWKFLIPSKLMCEVSVQNQLPSADTQALEPSPNVNVKLSPYNARPFPYEHVKLSPNVKASPSPYVNVIKNLDAAECKIVNLEKLKPPVKICVFENADDIWVSKDIAKGGFFEAGHVQTYRSILQSHPELGVIDIGANIGQYSLLGAHMGRQVVSVEARKLHVHMVYRAMQLNGFLGRLTLLHNAISDSHEQLQLAVKAKNQGGTHVIGSPNNTVASNVSLKDDLAVTSIKMDDLVSVLPENFTQAFLKMDIEGFEDRAFAHAKELFKRVYIPFIMVEWVFMRQKPPHVIQPVLDFLQEQQYDPFWLNKDKMELRSFSSYKEWGYDVMLKHKNANL